MGPGLILQPKINGPRNIFCIMQKLLVCLCVGQNQGVGLGGLGGGFFFIKSLQKSNLHIYCSLGRVERHPPQGSLTHIAMIFKFGDVSGPRAKKWPKVNRGLKIVNYFTCMRHFSCRWYRPPEVDLNRYPRISNPYCCDIQIQRCEWTQGKKMTQSKLPNKNS